MEFDDGKKTCSYAAENLRRHSLRLHARLVFWLINARMKAQTKRRESGKKKHEIESLMQTPLKFPLLFRFNNAKIFVQTHKSEKKSFGIGLTKAIETTANALGAEWNLKYKIKMRKSFQFPLWWKGEIKSFFFSIFCKSVFCLLLNAKNEKSRNERKQKKLHWLYDAMLGKGEQVT